MAQLKSSTRNALPSSKFALPASRRFPIEDHAHAANAKARAKMMLDEHKISRSTYNEIVAAANRELAK
jgi:hypothetical protein